MISCHSNKVCFFISVSSPAVGDLFLTASSKVKMEEMESKSANSVQPMVDLQVYSNL